MTGRQGRSSVLRRRWLVLLVGSVLAVACTTRRPSASPAETVGEGAGVVRLDPATGALSWSAPLGPDVVTSVVVHRETVVVSGTTNRAFGTVGCGHQDNPVVTAFDVHTGRPRWTRTSARVTAGPEDRVCRPSSTCCSNVDQPQAVTRGAAALPLGRIRCPRGEVYICGGCLWGDVFEFTVGDETLRCSLGRFPSSSVRPISRIVWDEDRDDGLGAHFCDEALAIGLPVCACADSGLAGQSDLCSARSAA